MRAEKSFFGVLPRGIFALREEDQWHLIEGGSCKKVPTIQNKEFKDSVVSTTTVTRCREDNKGLDAIELIRISEEISPKKTSKLVERFVLPCSLWSLLRHEK